MPVLPKLLATQRVPRLAAPGQWQLPRCSTHFRGSVAFEQCSRLAVKRDAYTDRFTLVAHTAHCHVYGREPTQTSADTSAALKCPTHSRSLLGHYNSIAVYLGYSFCAGKNCCTCCMYGVPDEPTTYTRFPSDSKQQLLRVELVRAFVSCRLAAFAAGGWLLCRKRRQLGHVHT